MPESIGDECWLPIEGYHGFYEVSDQGRVRSLNRTVPGKWGPMRLRGQILRPSRDSWGHLQVLLSRESVQRHRLVHQLVTAAFLGPRPDGLITLHGPGGQLDNSVANLSYGTHGQNIRDKRRDGTDHNVNKTRCPAGHLLQVPNLVRCAARDGHRNCLACSRGRTTVRWSFKRHGIVLDVRAESDAHYVKIMAGVAA